jgi:hypothetical protein
MTLRLPACGTPIPVRMKSVWSFVLSARITTATTTGVTDKDDKCPDTSGPERNGGCPEDIFAEKGVSDRDADEIPDHLDLCPDVPGPTDNNGCPWGDRDGDGIADHQDDCPGIVGVAMNKRLPGGTTATQTASLTSLTNAPTWPAASSTAAVPTPTATTTVRPIRWINVPTLLVRTPTRAAPW